MENRKVRAPSGVVVEEIETLPMSLTLKLKVGKHRICSHVELGSLEVQLTAIMSSLSVLEHCHSQMKGSWQANLLNASIQELSALRHLVLKFARRAPLLEAEESTSSDTLARWAGGPSQLEDPDQMRLSSDPSMSEDSVGGGLNAPPSAPTSAEHVTSRTSKSSSKSRSSKSSGSSGSPKSNESAGAADSTGSATKTRFRPSKLFSAMKGLLSKKKSRVEVNNDDQDDGEDDDPIDSESDEENRDVMSSVMPSRPGPAPPFRSGAAPPRYPCHSLGPQQHTVPPGPIRTAAQFRNARHSSAGVVHQRYQRS